MTRRRLALQLSGALAAVSLVSSPVQAYVVSVSKLSDLNFTSLDPLASASASESLCVYSSEAGAYTITANGSGASGAFTLSAGAGLLLAYGVQWGASAGATSGVALSPGVPLVGQNSLAQAAGCVLGLTNTASLIVTLASTDLQSAAAGVSYTGTLTLLVAPQ